MNLVACGLPPREAAAFEFFLKRSMSGWSWRLVPPERDTVLPEADVLVVDMAAMGLAQHSPETEAALLKATHGLPAVLLLPSSDQTWAALDEAVAERWGLIRLSKPYGSEAMRRALEQASAAVRARGQPVVATHGTKPRVSAPAPVSGVTGSTAAPVAGVVTSVAKPAPVTVKPAGAPVPKAPERAGLSPAGLHEGLAGLPQVPVFLRQLAELLMQGRPFEVRLTIQNSVIFHPADNWIASNTPTEVFRRVCRSDALASALSVREIDDAAAESRAQQLGMQVRELEEFLAELVEGMPLGAGGGSPLAGAPAARPVSE